MGDFDMWVARRKDSYELAGTGAALLFWRTEAAARDWLKYYRTDPDKWELEKVRASYAKEKIQKSDN